MARASLFWTPTGNVLARLGRESYGDEPGRFYSPHSLAVDSKGDIYVAEVSWSEYGSKLDPPRELRSLQKLIHQPVLIAACSRGLELAQVEST